MNLHILRGEQSHEGLLLYSRNHRALWSWYHDHHHDDDDDDHHHHDHNNNNREHQTSNTLWWFRMTTWWLKFVSNDDTGHQPGGVLGGIFHPSLSMCALPHCRKQAAEKIMIIWVVFVSPLWQIACCKDNHNHHLNFKVMEIVPKKRATPSEGGWLARRGCHLDENSRVMGELVPKPLTPSSSPVSSSSSSLSDVRSGDQDQDQGLGSRITQTLFHCF